MGSYNWMAIPEGTWTAFAAAFAGLVVTILVVTGVDAAIVGAVGVFIAAFFRMVVAFLAALSSDTGSISTGTGTDTTPIPPSESGGNSDNT